MQLKLLIIKTLFIIIWHLVGIFINHKADAQTTGNYEFYCELIYPNSLFSSTSIFYTQVPSYVGAGNYYGNTIQHGADVEFSAGYSVVLKPPFHVKPGAKFHAYIDKKCTAPPPKIKTFPGISINIGSKRDKLPENSHKLDDVEAFPSVVTTGSPVYLRLMGELQNAKVRLFWTFTDGSSSLAHEITNYQGETIYLNAPRHAGLYRLTIVVEEQSSYEVKSVPIIVY